MLENKKKNKSSKINESNRISIWKILAAFVVVNLVVINFINYLQPNSNLRLKNNEQKKNATMAAYDLQNSLNQFKVNPDSYAYLLIQKSVELTSFVNNIEISNSNIKTDAQNLSQNIEQLVAKIPSLKLFQQQVEKILRVNKNLKQINLENLENLENSKVTTKIFNTINFTKNLLLTEEKIDNILQILKYNYWLSEDLITKYQNNIEEIGLEIDQLINTSLNNNIN
ncbi:MAG: hypothetical protein KBD64_03375, partial [Gammaproteobacteria bacterium]|nr:hypothetical protein [Gammaproteobacteria bacterium]